MSRFYKGTNTRKSDRERELWVMNDEGMYREWRRSGLPAREYIRQNREWLDECIDSFLGRAYKASR